MKSWRADLHYNPADILVRDKEVAFLEVLWVASVCHVREGQRKTSLHPKVFPATSRGEDVVTVGGPGSLRGPSFLDSQDLDALL
eukprot:6178517-Pyramimonas_sp.AAC.1